MRPSGWLPALAILSLAVISGATTPALAANDGSAEEAAEIAAAAEECDPLFDDCGEEGVDPASFPDPWEAINRGTLAVNQAIDTVLLNPLTKGYAFVVPSPVRLALRRFFDNLDSTSVVINDGLQLEWVDMGTTLVRFVVNTTVGLAGFFDPAAALGLEGHHSDFGQTLTLAGLPSGPYLMLPLLGPTTVRDGYGVVVDATMSPLLYVLGPLSFEQLYRAGSMGLSLREEHLRDLEALEASSVDFYAAMRSAYYQNRQAEIWQRREHRRPGEPLGMPWRALSGPADDHERAARGPLATAQRR